jgi:TolA-binding protein
MSVLFDTLEERKDLEKGKETKENPFTRAFVVQPKRTLSSVWLGAALTTVFVVSLGALGGAGYLYWLFQNQQQGQATLEANQVQISERIKAAEDQLNRLRGESEATQGIVQDSAGQSAQFRNELEEFQGRFSDLREKVEIMETFDEGLALQIQRLDAELATWKASLGRPRD